MLSTFKIYKVVVLRTMDLLGMPVTTSIIKSLKAHKQQDVTYYLGQFREDGHLFTFRLNCRIRLTQVDWLSSSKATLGCLWCIILYNYATVILEGTSPYGFSVYSYTADFPLVFSHRYFNFPFQLDLSPARKILPSGEPLKKQAGNCATYKHGNGRNRRRNFVLTSKENDRRYR